MIVYHMANQDGSPFPSNSLEGIASCLKAGASFIEIDITALASEDYLLVHDAVLDNETSGTGKVELCSVEQAKTLTIKQKDGITSYHVPMLREVVNLFLKHGGECRLQLDFKNVFPTTDDEILGRLIDIVTPLGNRALVSSGADWHLQRLHRLAPSLDLGFDIGFYLDYRPTGSHPDLPPFRLGAYGLHDDHPLASRLSVSFGRYMEYRCEALLACLPSASTWYVNHHLLVYALDEGFNMAEWLHTHHLKLDAWTLDAHNEVAARNAPRLRDAGVDQFTTNTPTGLGELLGQQVK